MVITFGKRPIIFLLLVQEVLLHKHPDNNAISLLRFVLYTLSELHIGCRQIGKRAKMSQSLLELY